MNIKLLQKIIESYKLCQLPFVEDEQERTTIEKQCEQLLNELNEIEKLVGPKDYFDGDCYVLHAETVIDLLNVVTYDAYGKLYAEYNGDVAFGDYEAAVRQRYGCDYAATAVLEVGFDIISDLYKQNEENDCHNQDGTFRHTK